MKKKITLSNTELSTIFNLLGGSIAPAPAQICIDTVYINVFNLLIDGGYFETYCALSSNTSVNLNDQKKQILDELKKGIALKRIELDQVILENKKVINGFFEDTQNESEKNGIPFNEKSINSFWRNLNGGSYGGGKNFLNNAIKSICSYSDKSSYKSNVFLNPLNAKPLIFDKGAMSYICARPSAGKTTALINIAMDGLHQGKKVVFFTAEESIEQLSVKFIKNEFFYSCRNSNCKNLPGSKLISSDTQEYFKNRIKYLFTMTETGREDLKRRVKGQSNDQDLIDYKILQAIEYINELAQTEQLQFVVVSLLSGFDGLIKELSLQEPETIVLLDYIQKLPIPQSAMNYTQSYSQIKNLVNELSSVVRDNGLIGIAGAQMGRETDKGKTEQLLSMSYIRESGDIENDGTLCIGIGKNKDTNERFFNVMKYRNGEYNETVLITLEDNYAYTFTRTAGTLNENGYFEMEKYKSKPEQNKIKKWDED